MYTLQLYLYSVLFIYTLQLYLYLVLFITLLLLIAVQWLAVNMKFFLIFHALLNQSSIQLRHCAYQQVSRGYRPWGESGAEWPSLHHTAGRRRSWCCCTECPPCLLGWMWSGNLVKSNEIMVNFTHSNQSMVTWTQIYTCSIHGKPFFYIWSRPAYILLPKIFFKQLRNWLLSNTDIYWLILKHWYQDKNVAKKNLQVYIITLGR